MGGFCLLQTRVKPDALIEHKAFAVVVRAAAFLKIFQDAPVELENLFETFALHERPGLFAADAARAKHDDRLLLHRGRQFANGLGEITEMIHANRQRIFERAELHLIIIARVEQRHGATFVEPPLEILGRQLGRGALGRIYALDTERYDFLLEPHQHPAERLMIGLAELGLQIFPARQAAQFGQQ